MPQAQRRVQPQPAAASPGASNGTTNGAAECATEVLAVMPAVMDALRGAMRLHTGDALSVPQFRCLNYIHLQPGASISSVAAFLGVTMPTASAMVDRLVRSGAIAPATAAADRRRIELQTTRQGRTQLRQIRRGAHGEFTRVLSTCSATELKRLNAGLAVLRRAFDAG